MRPPARLVSYDTSPPPQARRVRSWPCEAGHSPSSPQDPPLRGPGPIDPPADPRPEAGPQEGSPRGRTLPASIEPMLHIDDLAALLSCSRRLIERMRAAGKIPCPDIMVG